MKVANRLKTKPKMARVTVSIGDGVHERGLARAGRLFRGNFSAYVESLIAVDVREANGEVRIPAQVPEVSSSPA
jgi:hypothetical protein